VANCLHIRCEPYPDCQLGDEAPEITEARVEARAAAREAVDAGLRAALAADETPTQLDYAGTTANCDPLGCTIPGCHRDPQVCRYAPQPEQVRREIANAHRDEVVEGSGEAIEPRELPPFPPAFDDWNSPEDAVYGQPDVAPSPDVDAGGAGLDVEAIRARQAAYRKSHDHPGAFACCTAHASADDVPALIDEVARSSRRNGHGETQEQYWKRRFHEVCDRLDESGMQVIGLHGRLTDAEAKVERLTGELDEARAKTEGGEWTKTYGWRFKDGSPGSIDGLPMPPVSPTRRLVPTEQDHWHGPVRDCPVEPVTDDVSTPDTNRRDIASASLVSAGMIFLAVTSVLALARSGWAAMTGVVGLGLLGVALAMGGEDVEFDDDGMPTAAEASDG
jgi:hypothetical protein